MTSPLPSSADTTERLGDCLALITAAQAMLRGQLDAQVSPSRPSRSASSTPAPVTH